MKKWFTIALASTLLLALTACGSSNGGNNGNTGSSASPNGTEEASPALSPEPTDAPKPDKLRIAYHPNMGGSSAIITGMKKDFFNEQNIEIELVKFTSGPTEVAAMISGDIDLGYVGHGAHFLAVEGKVKIISLDVLSKAEELMVRADSGIAAVKDLKGKTIATQLGTSGEIVLDLALKKEGMTRDDVKLVNMDMAGAVSAFIADKVDAVIVWAPYSTEIKKEIGKDNITVLANSASFSEEFVFPSSWIVTPDYLDKNEDKVVRFLKGLHKAMDYRAEHLDEVVGYVAELNATPVESVQEEVESGVWMTGTEVRGLFADGTAKKWYEQQQELFLSSGKLEKGAPVESYVTFDLMGKVAE
ncbi:aliphatic sulfonate ABC transporter substrate-binding protein [Paenibacillus nanensis]|uniref:Aliphatic sulfonate ABC transporter substrate-binding protein n=1 Tax=Paenibacillus nanensis TaxID=393251 RepID=A0A3A1V1H8_9BACL|nr:aliphatic sulfonate ABC transporter substrate-binding protein [Paenibacillus nanensis]RIX52403.1 aliphatic sulfonate ABC transporter substrate-binding protein [Paenibacillus nanensis]